MWRFGLLVLVFVLVGGTGSAAPADDCTKEDQRCGKDREGICVHNVDRNSFQCLMLEDTPVWILPRGRIVPRGTKEAFRASDRIRIASDYVEGGIGWGGRTECRITECQIFLASLEFEIGSHVLACSRRVAEHTAICRVWAGCDRDRIAEAITCHGSEKLVQQCRDAEAARQRSCDAIATSVAAAESRLSAPTPSSGPGLMIMQ